MTEIDKFYQSVNQDVATMQLTSEEGDSQEQSFTRYCLDILSDAGETENATVAYDERDLRTPKQHKINGYAISESYETVDLFISLYKYEEMLYQVYKADIQTATKRLTNFFKKAFNEQYENNIEPSSEIFYFAHTLGSFKKLRKNLVRINAIILTNGEYKGDIPQTSELFGVTMIYRVLDINSLYQMSDASHLSIEIDFKERGYTIPCLSSGADNDEYEAYVAVMPGDCLASLYKDFGSRLLEQNVRSFLQFGGGINKGMRDTIRNAPQMFFAYNNGLAATADHIEFDKSGKFITKISNFQIVNGGQTTASIYYTMKKYGADVSRIAVQVKISVIKDKEQYGSIVSLISQFANTQNKVNNADFTANNPILVQFEILSRQILSPLSAESAIQTRWFFERARGQYKTQRQKEGGTKSRDAQFDKKNPSKQKITKTELAKYINAWEECTWHQKLVVGPHIVVLGNEKNYARFITHTMPKDVSEVNNVYFEDTIAKTILFREADLRYGTKKSGNPIGELRNVVVPYTMALLNRITNGHLDLYKIWRAQKVSKSLSDFIYKLMLQMNEFILQNAEGSHYIEWAKREECWTKVKAHQFEYNLHDIAADMFDPENPPVRRVISGEADTSEKAQQERAVIESITPEIWEKIANWGRDTEFLELQYQNTAREIARKLRRRKELTDAERIRAMVILDTLKDNEPDLLGELL